MSKRKKKKQNKVRPMPPLSKLDERIYNIIGLLLMVGYGALLLWLTFLGERLAFRDASVIAVSRHESQRWMIPGMVCLGLTLFGVWIYFYMGRQPILGMSGVEYGPPFPKKYPLLWKDKQPRKPEERAEIRYVACLILCVNLLFLLLMLLGVQGRSEWNRDGSVEVIDMLGRTEAVYASEDVEQVTLGFDFKYHRNSSIRGYRLYAELELVNGERYRFLWSDLRHDRVNGDRSSLWNLKSVLEQYPKVLVQDAEKLDEAIEDMDLNEAEAEVLRQLFGTEN